MEAVVPRSAGAPQARLAGSPSVDASVVSTLAQSEVGLLSHELDLARDIQRAQNPKYFPPIAGFGLAGFSFSARHLAGDFFDALPAGKGKVLLAIADVMGKGVAGALFAATLRPLLRTLIESTLDPAVLLARLNRLLYQELDAADVFITAQLALVDSKRKRLIVAAAGHCPLLFYDRTGQTRTISPEGLPLGILPDAKFEKFTLPLNDCECAVLFTDGLIEARDMCGRTFGFDSWLRRNLLAGQLASELCASLQSELHSFQAHAPLSDDQTVLFLARREE